MKKIPLTKGKFALVDDEDYESLMVFRWFANKPRECSGKHYAIANAGYVDGKRKKVRMHRVLAADVLTKAQPYVDHIDGNGLNNQRANLRAANRFQNCQNVGRTAKNTSGYKGVSYVKQNKIWKAEINKNGKRTYLGCFDTPELAHAAYCAAAEILHGAFRRTK